MIHISTNHEIGHILIIIVFISTLLMSVWTYLQLLKEHNRQVRWNNISRFLVFLHRIVQSEDVLLHFLYFNQIEAFALIIVFFTMKCLDID